MGRGETTMGRNYYEKAYVKITFFGADDVLATSDPNELPMVPVGDWSGD